MEKFSQVPGGLYMEKIESAKNNFIKMVKKLAKKKYREETGLYLIEGEHLVEEALRYQGSHVMAIIVTPQGRESLPKLLTETPGRTLYLVKDDIFKALSAVPTPQGIIALVKLPSFALPETIKGPLLLLDNVQDPGNVGTMIRTADAANYAGVILGEGCADVYSPKVIRSMQGSQFHLPVYEANLGALIPTLKKSGLAVYGTELNPAAVDYRQLPAEAEFALIMGNEGQGVSHEILEMVDKAVYIPIDGQAESLNVAVAAGILMFTLSR